MLDEMEGVAIVDSADDGVVVVQLIDKQGDGGELLRLLLMPTLLDRLLLQHDSLHSKASGSIVHLGQSYRLA